MQYSAQVTCLAFGMLAGALAVLSGCGSDNMASVSGVVKRNGKILTAGRVIFRPLDRGKPGFGSIYPDGTFTLMTEEPDDGAIVGSYRVVVLKAVGSDSGERPTSYVGPSDQPLEVAAGRDNHFIVDVNEANGWRVLAGD